MPVSSVMSLIHNENIDEPRDDQVSTWKYPEDIEDWKKEYYQTTNKRYQAQAASGQCPLTGQLQSAYSLYQLPEGEDATEGKPLSRTQTNPRYTNYTVSFKGTLDHILYEKNKLEVLELLELPSDEVIKSENGLPSTQFPSDHLRIEARFLI